MRIDTKGADGKPNGYLILGWNVNEQPSEQPAQIYHTAIAPNSCKGPHLHKKRCGRFQCVVGNVKIVTRGEDGKYNVYYSGEDYGYAVIKVEPGVAAALYNSGDAEALVMNMPSPAWSEEDPDEWPVADWPI